MTRFMRVLWEIVWPPLVFWGIVALLYFLCVVRAHAAPQDAVVRLSSHGASGTVVWVGGGRSLVLSCAHAFEGRDRTKPITIDAPNPNPGQAKRPGVRVLKVDHVSDLSLLEVGAELPYVCPIAEPGHKPGRLLSTGYDEMAWPATRRAATILSVDAMKTWTREKPWHGRSGGGLIDLDAGRLVGVVHGYTDTAGIYVSHGAVLRFVGWTEQAVRTPAPSPGRPWVSEQREQMRPAPRQWRPVEVIGAPPCPT